MKKFKLLFLLFIYSIYSQTYQLNQDSLINQINLKEASKIENLLQRQIESYLSQVLTPNSYLVTTSARVSVIRTPEVSEEITDSFREETNPDLDSQRSKKTETKPPVSPEILSEQNYYEYLPGLEPIDGQILPLSKINDFRLDFPPPQERRRFQIPSGNQEPSQKQRTLEQNRAQFPVSSASKQEKTTTTKNFKYQEKLVVDDVRVNVVLDDKLEANLVNTIKRVLSEKIDGSYGEKGSILFTSTELIPAPVQEEEEILQQPQEEVKEEVVKDLDYYLDKYSFLIYMFFAVFVFFVMLLIFFFFIWLFIRMLLKRNQEEEQRNQERQQRLIKNVTPNHRQPQTFPPYPPTPPYPYGGGYYDMAPPPPPNFPPYPNNNNVVQTEKTKNPLPSPNPAPIIEKKQQKPIIENIIEKPTPPLPKKPEDPVSLYNFLKKQSIEKEKEFLEKFVNLPLVARNFFINLEPEEKEELIGAFPKQNTRKIFGRLSKDQEMTRNSKLDQMTDETEKERLRQRIFNKYIEALEQHEKLLDSQIKDVFGQISLLTSQELNMLFSSLDADAIANSYQVIDSNLILNYLEKLPDQKKNDFIKAMKLEKTITEDEINNLKQIYRNRIHTISRNIFIDKPDKNELQNKVFQSVKDKKVFLEKLRATDPEFYEENKKYTIDFNDFLDAQTNPDSSQIFYRTIEDSNNETLTDALANLPVELREGSLANLGMERRELINETMLPKIGQIDKDLEEESRELLLNSYRDKIFR